MANDLYIMADPSTESGWTVEATIINDAGAVVSGSPVTLSEPLPGVYMGDMPGGLVAGRYLVQYQRTSAPAGFVETRALWWDGSQDVMGLLAQNLDKAISTVLQNQSVLNTGVTRASTRVPHTGALVDDGFVAGPNTNFADQDSALADAQANGQDGDLYEIGGVLFAYLDIGLGYLILEDEYNIIAAKRDDPAQSPYVLDPSDGEAYCLPVDSQADTETRGWVYTFVSNNGSVSKATGGPVTITADPNTGSSQAQLRFNAANYPDRILVLAKISSYTPHGAITPPSVLNNTVRLIYRPTLNPRDYRVGLEHNPSGDNLIFLSSTSSGTPVPDASSFITIPQGTSPIDFRWCLNANADVEVTSAQAAAQSVTSAANQFSSSGASLISFAVGLGSGSNTPSLVIDEVHIFDMT